jgi:hypothetical protein|tara:strand:- start:298 stop:621 length:324 start_codon:yes stop_codon:yes gene_type:complete
MTYTRSGILDTAKQYVTKDRDAQHGNMEDNFEMIAELWEIYLGVTVYSADVAAMMTLLKIARSRSNPMNLDNWIDSCGYMACGGEIISRLEAEEDDIDTGKIEGGNA